VEDGEVDDARALPAQAKDNIKSAKQSVLSATSSNVSLAPANSSAQDKSLPTSTEPVAREGTPKLTTNKASQSVPSARSEVGRNSSTTSVLEKPHPGLPSRPDVPFPSHISPNRHLPSRQDDRRDVHQGRVDRPSDVIRDRVREPLNFDRRAPELLPRDMGRLGDRSTAAERDRDRHDSKRRGIEPFRDIRDGRDSRDHRDRGPPDNSRLHDVDGRLSRNDDMQPPRSTTAESSAGSVMNPDPPINPARAAQIFGTAELPRSEPARASREEHRDRPSSRPHSPRRDRFHGPDRDHAEARRNDRPPSGRPPSYVQEYTRGRHDEPQPSMAGSRGDWTGDRGSFDRSRDASAFQPTPPLARLLDPDHGRLNQSSRSQDPNFGRLNPAPAPAPAPASQIPSGPSRDRGSRNPVGGNRMASAPQPRFDPRPSPQEPARPPTPDKQPPTGPAASRAPRRTGSGIIEPPTSAPLSTPTTPAAASPTAGVHPERLRRIEPIAAQQAGPNTAAQVQQQPAATPSATIPTGVHPSRLQAFQEDHSQARQGPPPIQTSNINSPAPRPASPLTTGPPSGPKSLQSTSNNIMSPNGITPPTGPASANDRNPRTTLRQIQNTINQAGHRGTPERMSERGTNIRGRSSRNSLAGPVSDLPPSPVPLTPIGLPANRDGAGSVTGDRGRDLINPERPVDLFPSRAPNGADSERDRERERADSRSGAGARREGARSGRHSRRASRSRSPVRDVERERERDRVRERGTGPMDDAGRGEYRDRGGRGGAGGGDGRDLRHSERDTRRRDGEKRGDGRDLLVQPRNEPEWGSGASGAGIGSGGGGGPGPGGPRRDMRSGDARRDTRSDGRKRRGEEGGMGSDIRGHDKRPRR
jgi:THO complex subunit 2